MCAARDQTLSKTTKARRRVKHRFTDLSRSGSGPAGINLNLAQCLLPPGFISMRRSHLFPQYCFALISRAFGSCAISPRDRSRSMCCLGVTRWPPTFAVASGLGWATDLPGKNTDYRKFALKLTEDLVKLPNCASPNPGLTRSDGRVRVTPVRAGRWPCGDAVR